MNKLLLFFLLLSTQAFGQRVVNISSMQKPAAGVVGFYRQGTINHSLVSNTTQTNFPVLISVTYADLATTAHGGDVQNINGYDITFASDSLGNTPLNWDVEYYNPVNGNLIAWVNIPSLSASVNTVFYMKYGNSAITTYQGNRPGTWNNGFYAVWHMNATPTGAGQTVADATSNGINLTTVGSWTSAQQTTGAIGPSLQFLHANGDYMTFITTTLPSTYTIEGDYNITVADNTSFSVGSDVVATFGNNINWFADNCRLFNGAGSDIVVDPTAFPTSTWVYEAFTVSGSAAIAYHNGTQAATSSSGTTLTFKYLGFSGGSITSNLTLDEMRISTVTRSSDWITTTYNTEHTPATFITFGSVTQ